MIEVDRYQPTGQLHAVGGLSQREIARNLGVSRNTVKRYWVYVTAFNLTASTTPRF
ncbi:MAG: helix-turn-helix domain-containing protein [Bacillota bacterium]|nr:helix-turn-helix domain-containing protein [Bacillota bacterium]